MSISYVTMVREGNETMYKFAEIKYGKIVSINEHWVPLEEYVKFFEAGALFIDITDVLIDGEAPAVGDTVTTGSEGYIINHIKRVYSPAEMKAYVVEKMKLMRDRKELEPIEHNGFMFDADKDAITRMDIARKTLEDNGMESILWTTYDNDHTPLRVEDFAAINTAMAIRSTQLHDRYNRLKNYIYSVEDTSVLNDFDWDYELPEA